MDDRSCQTGQWSCASRNHLPLRDLLTSKKRERETRGARNEFQSGKHPLSSPRNEIGPDLGQGKNFHEFARGRKADDPPSACSLIHSVGQTQGKGKVSLGRRNSIVVPSLNGFARFRVSNGSSISFSLERCRLRSCVPIHPAREISTRQVLHRASSAINHHLLRFSDSDKRRIDESNRGRLVTLMRKT